MFFIDETGRPTNALKLNLTGNVYPVEDQSDVAERIHRESVSIPFPR